MPVTQGSPEPPFGFMRIRERASGLFGLPRLSGSTLEIFSVLFVIPVPLVFPTFGPVVASSLPATVESV